MGAVFCIGIYFFKDEWYNYKVGRTDKYIVIEAGIFMITVKETTVNDLDNIKRLWADGDVMKFVGFPEGLQETDESMKKWFCRIASNPNAKHFSVFENDVYCGEAFYDIDTKHENSAALDIKLFKFARGRGIATTALSHAIRQAFKNGADKVWVDPNPKNEKAIALYERLGFERKPMPEYLGEYEGFDSIYMELSKKE